MYPLIRQILFRLDPETAHLIALTSLNWLAPWRAFLGNQTIEHQPVNVMGLSFPNWVGIAAGLDKNGRYLNGLSTLGVGFIEIGTLTPRAQPGNAKPRLFRLIEAKALINRMGFNNSGLLPPPPTLRPQQNRNYRLGINIGKNFQTPIENALSDYQEAYQQVYPLADYVTLNISSPNTKNLRTLQQTAALDKLLYAMKSQQKQLQHHYQKYVPLAVKIAPDLTAEELDEIAQLLLQHEIDGVIATNTTLNRYGLSQLPQASEEGGLSGLPLFERSLEVVSYLRNRLDSRIPIIGVGGIQSPEQALRMRNAGASLIQVYTGLIYQGPKLIKNLIYATS